MLTSIFKKSNSKAKETTLAHDDYFNALRDREYSRLSKEDQVYLDYTGGNLYGSSQLIKHHDLLSKNVLGNPHSTNPTSKRSTELVSEARQKVLEFFNAEDYYCIFTANASGALKIVGECYPFSEDGHYLLFADNHNSVNGIREYCTKNGGEHEYVPIKYTDLTVDEKTLASQLTNNSKKNKLFAFPAQSNVSGVKHDLAWIEKAQNKGWDVLLDAAAYVPTTRLDLTKYKPEFVSVSFYKIFGYPTGLGCLLVKKSAFSKLQKRWFAGGTVTLVSVASPHHFLVNNHERFENGTVNYLDIPAVKLGLDYIEQIGIDRITERVESLIGYLHDQLKNLKHSNGVTQLDIFGPSNRKNTGGTLIMNFKNSDGTKINFETIDKLANERNISIRSGCFCNPGIDEINNCLTTVELSNYFSNHETGDYHDMVSVLNKMRGATRVSVGIATTKSDIDAYVDFVESMKDKSIKD